MTKKNKLDLFMGKKVSDEIITRRMIPLYVEAIFTLCTAAYIAGVWYLLYFKPDLYQLFGCFASLAFFGLIRLFAGVVYFKLNITKRTFRKIYGFGFVKFKGSWKPLLPVEYVSVFCQLVTRYDDEEGYNYDVNVWYEGNKHLTVYRGYLSEPAFRLARKIG
jgi:hypothetical protein